MDETEEIHAFVYQSKLTLIGKILSFPEDCDVHSTHCKVLVTG